MSGLDFKEFHWMASMINSIDVGMVVLDNDFNIKAWNGFMEHHSNIDSAVAKDHNLFSLFPQIPEKWFRRKVDSVKTLENQSFITWEQRNYLFPFKNYRPITGTVEFMYQNVTIIPLTSLTGTIEQISLIIYDVTDTATNRIALQEANKRLRELSSTDPLTQLKNRGFLESEMTKEFANFVKHNTTNCLVMLDIDFFKKINDNYGHPAGDMVLQQLAKIINGSLRKGDVCARYGGEEFAIVLKDTDGQQSLNYIDRIRQKIEQSEFLYRGEVIKVTISFGVAETTANVKTCQRWLRAADEALYSAKDNGRNQGRLHKVSNVIGH